MRMWRLGSRYLKYKGFSFQVVGYSMAISETCNLTPTTYPTKRADKPGSVTGIARDGHSSRPLVAKRLMHPTRDAGAKLTCGDYLCTTKSVRTRPRASPIWACSRQGLPCRLCYQRRGGLLPHPFTVALHMLPASVV